MDYRSRAQNLCEERDAEKDRRPYVLPFHTHEDRRLARATAVRTAEGTLAFSNKVLHTVERDGKAILITPEFDKVYGQYLYDSFSDCVSRYSGSIVPQRRRVIGNPTCHMDVQFVSLFGLPTQQSKLYVNT